MANLSQLTQAQLDKLIQRPNWLSANTAIAGPIAGRVFASNEGWMLSPTKVHPEGKQMPAECVMAIPNLSEYLEYNKGTTQSAQFVAATTRDLIFTSVSVTRRSRSRYIVNIGMDETLISMGLNGVEFNFAPLTFPTKLPSTATLTINNFSVANGESFGRIQMDITSDEPLDQLEVTGFSGITLSVLGGLTGSVTDKNGGTHSSVALIDSDLGGKVDHTTLSTAFNSIALSDRWDGTTLTVVP